MLEDRDVALVEWLRQYVQQGVRRPQRDHADTLSYSTTVLKRSLGYGISDRLRNYRDGLMEQGHSAANGRQQPGVPLPRYCSVVKTLAGWVLDVDASGPKTDSEAVYYVEGDSDCMWRELGDVGQFLILVAGIARSNIRDSDDEDKPGVNEDSESSDKEDTSSLNDDPVKEPPRVHTGEGYLKVNATKGRVSGDLSTV
ncbi:uncharacterized protein An07g02590 [Aspergillus niger]|uniref:Contig An07c0060, genomic contig n=2 Tax=Aspergillus niger TaxID=5061 RepID=A2QMM0_ASPNC|nr:uncharacterized protein An07g02590 [Aspergillus niger]CAK39348.1 unnamed protein product [Aspergillus niger]